MSRPVPSPSARQPSSLRVAVVGAGVLGLACALELAERGARVTVCDPAAPLDNASGVAAGMLAPAFEAVLDPLSSDHFPILRVARDLWPDFAARIGAQIDRDGAIWAGLDPGGVLSRLHASGAEARLISETEATGLAPGLATSQPAVFTPEDWRIDAPDTLNRLRAAAAAMGVEFVGDAVVGFAPGEARLASGGRLAADLLVLAIGAAPASLAPELGRLAPVKGHILRLAGGPSDGPVVRGDGVYVRPHPRGAWVGATMEVGRTDRSVDATAVEALKARARVLFPHLDAVAHTAATGVRATTDDGLPLVGAGVTPGVLLCVGARRNGWLLAPLAARLIAALAFGEDGGRIAATLSPTRA